MHDHVDLVLLQDPQVDLAGDGHAGCRRGYPGARWRSWTRPTRRPARSGRLDRMRFRYSWSTPMWVRCMSSTTSRSIPRGAIPSFLQISCRFRGARLTNRSSPCCRPNSARHFSPTSMAISLTGPVADLHAQIQGHLVEFLFVLDGKPGNFPLGRAQKGLGHSPGMVGVGGGSRRRSCGQNSAPRWSRRSPRRPPSFSPFPPPSPPSSWEPEPGRAPWRSSYSSSPLRR